MSARNQQLNKQNEELFNLAQEVIEKGQIKPWNNGRNISIEWNGYEIDLSTEVPSMHLKKVGVRPTGPKQRNWLKGLEAGFLVILIQQYVNPDKSLQEACDLAGDRILDIYAMAHDRAGLNVIPS